MCGIAGVVGFEAAHPTARVERMTSRLSHRGPDGVSVGAWNWDGASVARGEAHVTLGHARLAIVDLSDDGQEPMGNEDGQLQLTFNGEIYNHVALRRGLSSQHRFRSQCDAEVLLHGLESHGPAFFRQLQGMFAFALVSLKERCVYLVRDPFGIKPLLYAFDGSTLAFGSELTALEAGGFAGGLDVDALGALVGLGFVPSSMSLRRGVQQVLPGHVLRVDAHGVKRVMTLDLPSLPHHRARGAGNAEAEAFHQTLETSVRDHLLADVEVGVLLSGGVDSTVVAALAQKAHGAPVRAFTLAVDHPGMDESDVAARTAQQLGVRHHIRRLSAEDALARLPDVLAALDEPLADASILPTRLVCELAREHVKVVLSGDGGDELLGGYTRHRLWESMARLRALGPLSAAAQHALAPVGDPAVNLAYALARRVLPLPPLHAPAHKLRRALASTLLSAGEAYGGLFRAADADTVTRLGLPDVGSTLLRSEGQAWEHADPLSLAQQVDLVRWIPDDILRKADRASMSVGLEMRVPLLHVPVMEAASVLPRGQLRQGPWGKVILRRWVATHVDARTAWADKRGFGLPLRDWMAGPLRRWRTELLGSLAERGVMHAHTLRALQDEHDAGTDRSAVLFALCSLETWWRARRGLSV